MQGDLLDDANVEAQVRARPKFAELLAARAAAAADNAEPQRDNPGAYRLLSVHSRVLASCTLSLSPCRYCERGLHCIQLRL